MSHACVLVAVECERADVEKVVQAQMEPFNESGEWFRNGSRWDWFVVGGRYDSKLPESIMRVGELKAQIDGIARMKAKLDWKTWENEIPALKPFWDMPEGETRECFIEKAVRRKLIGYAFLRGGVWYENDRLGFFGGTAKTECELAGRSEGKCIVGDIAHPPAIVGFNEPDERWLDHYWSRFIAPLPDSAWLVVVDYHV